MRRTLALTRRAKTDIANAFKWYELQRIGLGRRFLMSLDTVFSTIVILPHLGPEQHRGVRSVLLRRFPYAVYYRLEADRIEVLACLHQRRSPSAWRRR